MSKASIHEYVHNLLGKEDEGAVSGCKQEEDIKTLEALREAVSVIYLNDRSDYLPALWTIVRLLDPKVAKMLEEDERAALDYVEKMLKREGE